MLDSETKALLSRVAGDEAIDIGDPIWLRVLTCSSPLQRQDPAEITEVLTPICRNLVEHNVRTQNYAKLAWHGVEVLRSLEVEPAPRQSGVQRAIDTVCMLRLITKHVMELLRPADVRASLTLPSRAGGKQDGIRTAGGEDVLQSLTHTGLTVLLATEPKGLRYVLHAEVINLILVLASSQLYTTLLSAPLNVAPALEVLDAEGQAAASEILQYLLRHWIAQTKLPAGLKMHQAAPAAKPVAAADSAAGGMLSAMGRAAGSVLMLPLAAASMLSAPPPRSPLAAGCSMMLALLLQHAPPGGRSLNPYRQALSAMRDADAPPQLAPPSPSAASAASPISPDPATHSRLPFSLAVQPEASTAGAPVPRRLAEVSFRQLYEASASLLADGLSVLLLYSLLTICPAYLDYVLVRADAETLLLPLLQQLHATPPSAPNQLYTLQIILLILSQDASLATRLHKVVVPSVPWYRDRILLQVSLGSLVFMVVLKTAFQNLSLRSDVFLQTNSLGVLANLAGAAVGLSSTASQQLVSLLLHLDRRSRRLRHLAERPDGSLDRSTARQAANVFEDMARMVLEIVNCVLTNELARNPELVYALLHRQDALQQLREHPRYADILANVWVVLDFLNPKVEEAARRAPGAAWSSSSVLDVIQAHLRSLHPNRLRRYPELLFRFDEEPSSEEFFLPYVWSLVVEGSGLDFRQSCIVLFTAASLMVGKGEVGLPETLDLDAKAPGRDARGDGVRPSAGETLNAAEQLV